ITILRAIGGSESGNGYSKTRSLVITGYYTPICTDPITPDGSILPSATTFCDNGIPAITYSGSAPTGVTYYWQTSSGGTSTTKPVSSAWPYPVADGAII